MMPLRPPSTWLLTSPPAWLVGWLILAAVIAAITVTHHTY
ncbi:hypothetical protein FHS76_000477 [Ochrobactrum daejeonense]|uniref:Uncharacterized protein n=1 Tax=Brucella daejeonensis TaxID=659015 RepID=A0A7W9EJV5_9HYPH|nr:hypothetical protein [Brucella daejeonensis]